MKQYSNRKESMQENLVNDEEKEMSEISNIIDGLDIDKKDKEKIIAYIQKEEFRGPLPHPELLRQYNEVSPGFADKIMHMAMQEQNHRHELESRIVKSEISLNDGQLDIISASIKMKKRLQLFSFLLTFFLVIVGTICIFINKNTCYDFFCRNITRKFEIFGRYRPIRSGLPWGIYPAGSLGG